MMLCCHLYGSAQPEMPTSLLSRVVVGGNHAIVFTVFAAISLKLVSLSH